jgi:hypothetical protein
LLYAGFTGLVLAVFGEEVSGYSAGDRRAANIIRLDWDASAAQLGGPACCRCGQVKRKHAQRDGLHALRTSVQRP